MSAQLDTAPYPNVSELRAVREYIETHPREWAQALYANDCRTAFCFAGHTARRAGAQFHHFTGAVVVTPEHREVPTASYARQVLGLTYEEANDLFDGSNTLFDIDCVLAAVYARAAQMDAQREQEGRR